ncbi:hypothetical protein VTH06DRAFT_5861 [Thermothelomyces fergusii]
MVSWAVPRTRQLSPLLLLLLCQTGNICAAAARPTSEPHADLGRVFDYVVVGGGPGGLTIANRLSEDPSVSVAVVEAGTFIRDVVGNLSDVPGYDGRFFSGDTEGPISEVNWGFVTTPQLGAHGKEFPYPRGKALGGSTAINFMAYSVTSKGALDKWAELVGDKGYAYENMRKYYERNFDFGGQLWTDSRLANATPSFDEADVGTGGMIPISFPRFAQSWSTWAAMGFEAVGIKAIGALLHGKLLGSSWQVDTISPETGFRTDAATTYLFPVLDRPNLAVFNRTMATRILFDGDRRATGVQVSTANVSYALQARREVIVAAGALQTPQLLQVSGVGPADLLRRFGIPVVADLPGVGQGMSDHVGVPIVRRVNLETASTMTDEKMAAAVEQFNQNRTGPLASPGGDYYAGERLPLLFNIRFSPGTRRALATYPADWPDIEYLVLPTSVAPRNTSLGANYVTLLAMLQKPQSVGTVTISSASMFDKPVVNPNWVTAQADQEVLIAGLRRGRQIFDTIQDITIGPEFWPGPDVQTDEQILEAIRSSVFCVSHASCSCRMGTAGDRNAVVDSHARVFGVHNLRIVDASVLPVLLPGPSVHSSVYVLAEKIADDIEQGL